MNLSKLSLSQLVNLSLAVFLLLGIAVTTYTVLNLNNYNAEAARRVKTYTIEIDQADPHFGDTVTFATSGGGRYIEVVCYQTLAAIVYAKTQAVSSSFLLNLENIYGNPYDPDFAADCYAYLKNNIRKSEFLAMTRFIV